MTSSRLDDFSDIVLILIYRNDNNISGEEAGNFGEEASTPQIPYIERYNALSKFHNNVLIADKVNVSVTRPAVTSWEGTETAIERALEIRPIQFLRIVFTSQGVGVVRKL